MNEIKKVEAIPYIFKEEISPKNMKIYKFDNSWLTSALANIAENPFLIKRLIKIDITNDFGFFKIKLCRMGVWE